MRWLYLAVCAIFLLNLGACGTEAGKEPARLEIKHIPNPVSASLVPDTVKGKSQHKWGFRTEVTNKSSLPLKVVKFAFYTRRNSEWIKSNLDGKIYSNDEFVSWYDSGDSIKGGWILPGQTAADENNWVTNIWPIQARGLWRFVAVDSLGNEFHGEAEVYLRPYFEDKEYWRDTEPSELVLITGKVFSKSGVSLDDTQIRITPFRGTQFEPFDVVSADKEGAFELRAAKPGLYRILFYSPGYDTVSRILTFGESDSKLSIDITMGDDDETPGPVLEGSSRYLERIWTIDSDMSKERESSAAAYKEYSRTHKDPRGFNYDWSMPESTLTVFVEQDPHEAVRSYAALMLADVMRMTGSIREADKMEWLLEKLPPDSPYWGGLPQLPSWICFGNETYIERYLTRFAVINPDRMVRAHAILNLSIYFKGTGDKNLADEYYELALSEYSDLDGLEYLFDRANPDKVNRIRKGVELPGFEVTLIDGNRTISWKDLTGKYCLIHFWATWCAPCKLDMKYIHEAYEKYKDSNFRILSISVDSDKEKVLEFRKELWPMPWENAVETSGTASETALSFEVKGVPKMILVDPNGKIIETGMSLRGDKLVPFLEKCIN